jgi:hypothetical protein
LSRRQTTNAENDARKNDPLYTAVGNVS